MIRASTLLFSAVALAALALPFLEAAAQQQVPPAATPAPAPVFPKPDPASFTAATPTKEAVNAFMQASWGYDDSRTWQVQAILKTQAEGISKVVLLVGDKSGKQKPSEVHFYALPDGKHIIASDQILPFGEHPFAEHRALLQQKADGPYRGSDSKELEIVEFSGFQCPHCKDARASIDRLSADFPKARIVFQNYPLPQHPAAARAAAYGVCVAKLGGRKAFFQFASAVYEGQDGLAAADGATFTLNNAVTKAGLDPAKVAACAAMPETTATVDATVKLAKDLDIEQTPTLMINGRPVPANAPYETLKQIINYQEKLDGIAP